MMKRSLIAAFLIGACLLASVAGAAQAQPRMNPSVVSAFLMDLQGAIASNDKAAVASMASYPLKAGAKTYGSADQLVADFDSVFTPSVKASITGAKSSSLSSTAQGMSIAGQVAFADRNGFPKIVSVMPGQ